MTGIIHETVAGRPEDVLAAFVAAGLWLPDVDPPQLAPAVDVNGVPGGQMGPGGVRYVVPPITDPATGEVINTPEEDPRRTYEIGVANWNNPIHPPATLDAVIAAALPMDAGFFVRLRTLAQGKTLGNPEGDPAALIQPPQGPSPVSLPSLIFRLWAAHGVLTDDPVFGPIRTLAGVSLLVPVED